MNRTEITELCRNNVVSETKFYNIEIEGGFWEDDEYGAGKELNPIHNNSSSIYEIVRRKALSIVEHNEILSRDRIDTNDAVNLVFILFYSGNLNLHSDPEDFQNRFSFEVDEITKKVNQILIRDSFHDNDAPLQVPIDIISSLDELKDLKLSNTNVLSTDIMQEKKSTSLSLKRRSLCNLKNLDITYSRMGGGGAVLETQIFHLLPKLESITFRLFTGRTETMYIRNVLDDMQSSFCACQKTLTSVDLSYSMCTQDELQTLLLDVVPKLPNLIRINVSGNKIESVQRISESINKTLRITSSRLKYQNSLQVLDLSWNAIMLKIKNNPEEKAALMTVLHIFKGIFNLGDNINIKEYPPDMRYQLRMNHAGRRLTEGRCLCDKSISISLLPFALERAFQKSRDIYPLHCRDERKKDPTGIYYLFRSGPILHAFLRHRLADNSHVNPGRINDGGCQPRKHKRRKIGLSEFK